MTHKAYKHGHATFERIAISGMYSVRVYIGSELHDKVLCDDYRMARDYFRAFCAIAKNA